MSRKSDNFEAASAAAEAEALAALSTFIMEANNDVLHAPSGNASVGTRSHSTLHENGVSLK